MYEIFMSNFVTLFLISGFVILRITSDVFNKKIERLFAIGVTCVFLLVLVDITDSYMAHSATLHNARYFSSALGYTIRPIALGVFISILLRRSEQLVNLWIPIIIEGVIAMTNYWTHIMFYFDQNNVFYRGPLGLLPHSLCLVYMALLIYFALKAFNTTEIGEILTVLYIIGICLVAMFFETFFGMKYLLTGAIMCACTIYYTYLYSQIYKMDQLTGTFNRHTFDKDMNKRQKDNMVIVCIDLNDLKVINDTEGHSIGDEALMQTATILQKAAENKFRIYRMGGDEFFAVGYKKSMEDAKVFINRAKTKFGQSKYSASFGAALYKPNDDITTVCEEADKAMYLDKKMNKEKKINSEAKNI